MNVRMNKRLLLAVSLILLFIVVLFTTSCDPGITITVRNETRVPLAIFIGIGIHEGEDYGSVFSQSEVKARVLWHPLSDYTIEAKTTEGKVIYSEKLAGDDLKWLGLATKVSRAWAILGFKSGLAAATLL